MTCFEIMKQIFSQTGGSLVEDNRNCHKLVLRLGDYAVSFNFYGVDDHLEQVALHRPEILFELIRPENFAKLFPEYLKV